MEEYDVAASEYTFDRTVKEPENIRDIRGGGASVCDALFFSP